MLPGSIPDALKAVEGLRRGRTEAKESEKVEPVEEDHIEATKRFLSPHVCAMIELQLLTGARPGEICAMRTCDIDMTGKLWLYTPEHHKTEHHGHVRRIFIGPKAREILERFLRADLHAPLFSPAEATQWHRDQRHARRKTPLSCGNKPGTHVVRAPKIAAGERYTVASYRRAIARACDRADAWVKGGMIVEHDERVIPVWQPNQLRHNAGTRLRKEYGLEAAQVILGHSTVTVTQIYAEKNVAAAMKIMSEAG
jgi:integrase